jgi:hypothetical protein
MDPDNRDNTGPENHYRSCHSNPVKTHPRYNPRMSSAATIMPATFSVAVLFTLLFILIASGCVFRVLTQQWTTHRPMQALRDWAGDRRFKLHQLPIPLPPSLHGLQPLDPRIETLLTRGPVMLIRLTTAAKPAQPRPIWNLIIRETPQSQAPAGLRPADATTSFVDLFSLTGFPSLLPPDRFVIYATESRDARQLLASHVRGLLPADIGYLIHGPFVTLDFSSRPFDSIEFERVMTIMDQIIAADESA